MKRSKNGPECDCDQAAYIKRHGTPCPHWESILGPINGGGKSLIYTDKLERYETHVTPESEQIRLEEVAQHHRAGLLAPEERYIDDEQTLRTKLKKFGLSGKKVDVVIARLVHQATWKEIAIDIGYKEPANAARAFQDATEILKRKGYK